MDSVKKIDKYLIAKKIGKGSFASIYKVFNIEDDKTYALKRIDISNKSKKLVKTFEQEIRIMTSMNHDHILKLYKVIRSRHHINMIIEYCDSGDLHQYLSKLKTKILSEDACSDILCQISMGLQHLRQHKYIHRDLKPQNILLHSNGNGRYILKIADFGFTRELDHNNMAETICGSPLYMAPEVLHSQSYDERADLWSIGVLMYQMLFGNYPIEATNTIELVKKIKLFQLRLPHQQFSPQCIDLLERLLVKDPKHRIGFDQFYNHPFLRTPLSRSTAPIPITSTSSFIDSSEVGLSCSPFSPPFLSSSSTTAQLEGPIKPFSLNLGFHMSMPPLSTNHNPPPTPPPPPPSPAPEKDDIDDPIFAFEDEDTLETPAQTLPQWPIPPLPPSTQVPIAASIGG